MIKFFKKLVNEMSSSTNCVKAFIWTQTIIMALLMGVLVSMYLKLNNLTNQLYESDGDPYVQYIKLKVL